MKKIIFAICLFVMIQSAFAKDHWDLTFSNHTQNTGGTVPNVTYFYVGAINGDSITFFCTAVAGSSIVLNDGWYFNGVLIPNTAGANNITVIINQSCVYTAVNGGVGISADFDVSSVTGISSLKNINFLKVFPTAVTSSITIQLNSIKTNDIEISFFDMNGRQLKNTFYKSVVGEFIKNEDTEALAKGIYFLRIKAGEDVMEKKFVKM